MNDAKILSTTTVEPMAPLLPNEPPLPATAWVVSFYFANIDRGGHSDVWARSPGEAVELHKINWPTAQITGIKLKEKP